MNRFLLDNMLQLVTSRIASDGYECIEVEWEGKDRTIRVYIDSANGVGLSDCLFVTGRLEEWDDFESKLPESSQLEVSSPGIERPLRLSSHFRKAIGEKIRVKLAEKVLHKKQAVGKLVKITEDDFVSLETDDGVWEFPLKFLKRANVVYDWNQR